MAITVCIIIHFGSHSNTLAKSIQLPVALRIHVPCGQLPVLNLFGHNLMHISALNISIINFLFMLHNLTTASLSGGWVPVTCPGDSTGGQPASLPLNQVMLPWPAIPATLQLCAPQENSSMLVIRQFVFPLA